MTIYLSIFVAFSLLAITKLWGQYSYNIFAAVVALFLTIFIGYRYFVGVDWVTYELIFLDVYRMSLIDALTYGDSAYSLVNWAVARFDGQVWHVNLICAALFSTALCLFCGCLPRPGLALTVAVPTLIVVTAMGYTRQATAIACIMLAFWQFKGVFNWRWMAWLLLAILFHRSAIIVLPLFIVASSRQIWISLVIGGLLASILLFSIVFQNLDAVISLYFEGGIESAGALPRVAIGSFVGTSFFFIRNKEILGDRHLLVRNMAIAMIVLLPLFMIIPSNTVVDRIGILLLPFQSAVLAGLAASFAQKPVLESIATIAIIASYAAIFAVWLIVATFASYWIPYDNVLFVQWL